VIRSFGDQQTEALFADKFVRKFQGMARRVKRKLQALDAARRLEDLKVPPSNRLERLKGDLRDFHSIRVNDHGLSQNQLAKAIGISPNRIAEIVNNRRRITADTALRLGLYFGNSPEFWLNLQTNYDLKIARKNLMPEAVARIKAQRAA
jgi:addiction module HigA family antidote